MQTLAKTIVCNTPAPFMAIDKLPVLFTSATNAIEIQKAIITTSIF